ncbi:FAD/NAD(P)-binding protein [Galbibacter sp. BG1]|uniref:FAD/NAD(P)-binding protein n=1 Tax=Galbibacter sp. BG1 TaxID=1170699 RepID=UPI0015B9E228|nr:FAD/NAD(P)-binding protein [Galbibacter sp. BG1]QLE01287.1 FAD/NAD(P)-binding protein [Galbibacter sp. BG1]
MKKIAIIGIGPRGLSALESLLQALSEQQKQAEIILFETAADPGAGRIWNINQPSTNWLNISERDLKSLDGRPGITYKNIQLPAFPSYKNWTTVNTNPLEPDYFPPRNKIGLYFKQRYETLSAPLLQHGVAKLINSKITNIEKTEAGFSLKDQNENAFYADEVLLTVGHQRTEHSGQLKKWIQHAESNKDLIIVDKPYPVRHLTASPKIAPQTKVALRGFGLAMIDIMRALTIGRGAHFKIEDKETLQCSYHPTERVPKKIIPFSLDGKPMIPKPINEKIDSRFVPSKAQYQQFSDALTKVTSGEQKVDNIDFFKEAAANLSEEIYREHFLPKDSTLTKNDIKSVIINWLTDEDYKHDLLFNYEGATQKTIEAYLKMATGKAPISLDYCVGQVWRHCHDIIFDAFSYAEIEEDILVKAIALYDRMKRYSFGPPVESMQQMLALIKADVLSLDFVNNPDIAQVPQGWQFSMGKETITTPVLVNCVLDAPQLLKVDTPLIKNLLTNDLIAPVHSKLGIETNENASVLTSEENQIPTLSVLGRLAKGSVLGVDSISACFGERVQQWGDDVSRRI